MIYINEWLPNPTGSDTRGEFVEIFNDGSASVNLAGWLLKTQNGKKAKLSGAIGAGKYLVLSRSATKLALKNADEKIFLYDMQGKLVDQSGFLGVATEGKSFSRPAYSPSSVAELLRRTGAEAASAAKAGRQNYGGQTRAAASELPGFGASGLFSWADPTPGAPNSITANNLITTSNQPYNIPLNHPFGNFQLLGLLFSSALVLSALIFYALMKHENLSNLFFGRDEEAWL